MSSKLKLYKNTLISDINIPFWELVIDEVFLYPKPIEDRKHDLKTMTVNSLSLSSGLCFDEVCRKLRLLKKLSADIFINYLDQKENDALFLS